jgi:hypothetical protein
MLQQPNKKTNFLPVPTEKWQWVRAVGQWPAPSTKIVLDALRAKVLVLKVRHQIVLITPESGHEQGVWEIITRLFPAIEANRAKKLLRQHGR